MWKATFAVVICIASSSCASVDWTWYGPGYARQNRAEVEQNAEDIRQKIASDEKRLCAEHGWCGQHTSGEIINFYDSEGRQIGQMVEE